MANEQIETLKAQIGGIKEGDSAQKAQINDLKTLIDEMSEQKNKDVKGVDAKNIVAVKLAMDGAATKEQKFIMDSLAQLFSGEPGATYASKYDDYFFDAQQFGSTVRRVRPEVLEKDLVKEIAHRVN